MPEDIKPAKPAKAEQAAPATEPVAGQNTAAPAGQGAAKKKDNKTLKIVLIVVGVLVGLAVLGTIASILFFGALFKEAAENVDVNGDGQVTVQSDDGQTTTNIGENTQLAEGFPSDVPIFEPSTLLSSSKVNDNQYGAVARTAKSVAEVTEYYKTELPKQGWVSQLDSASSDGTLLSYQKDNRNVSVVVSTNTEESSNEKTGFVVTTGTNE